MWIDRNGGDSSTVKFVEIPFPSIPAALEAHRIDAAFITEPVISAARKNGRVLVYPWDAISKHFLVGCWFTTSQWAKDHPDIVKRFGAAIHDAAVWANKNPAKSGEILAKHSKIDSAVIATMARAHYAERLTTALVQPLVDLSAKYNGFSPFPARELLWTP
jgi:NitT/TauT family transport system substrate-binding protein